MAFKKLKGFLSLLFIFVGLLLAVYLVQQKVNIWPKASVSGNIDSPQIQPKPVISFGNSSYHDSLGVRDPYVVKNEGNYYLFYDCSEDLLNPSFESNLGVNGWDTWEADISSTTERKKFGDRSLKIQTKNTEGAGAFTGNYYYQNKKTEDNLAVPTGLEVTPNTKYIASAYFWATEGVKVELWVKQYVDDPGFYFKNWIDDEGVDVHLEKKGNKQWQRIYIPFTTRSDTRAITISLVAKPNTISYWDGIQLEKVIDNQTTPQAFPSDQEFNRRNYNRPLEDVVGWRSCLAVSNDGDNFDKRGLVEIRGTKQDWEKIEKPGWVGSSAIYLNPFYYNGSWYAYTWEAGYQVVAGNYALLDNGEEGRRRFGYGDRRGFIPNGKPTRSGIVKSSNIQGPYTRITKSLPPIMPDGQYTNCNSSSPWGCDYLAASGAPIKIENMWVGFLSGLTTWDEGWKTISSGIATSSNPIEGWEVFPLSPVLSIKDDPSGRIVPEGPIYYYDGGSGYHVIFVNNIGQGTLEAFVTRNILGKWPIESKKVIVGVDDVSWSKGNATINLGTVANSPNNTQINLYFGARPNISESNNWNKYLFHDIGLAKIKLPLMKKPQKSSELVMMKPTGSSNEVDFIARYGDYAKGVDNISFTQLIVDLTANWLDGPYRFRGMYVNKSKGGFAPGFYLWRPDKVSDNYGWGKPVKIGDVLENKFVKAKVISAKKFDSETIEVVWRVTFKQPDFGTGVFNIYLWMDDLDGNQDTETLPYEKVDLYGTTYHFTQASVLKLPF